MVNKFSKERVFYLIITLVIAIAIFLVSSISSFPAVETHGFDLSIVYHFGVFFMFTFFLTLTLTNKKMDIKTITIVLLISLSYAISDEFHQLFVQGRFADIKDAATDFLGSLCSVLLIKFIKKFRKI